MKMETMKENKSMYNNKALRALSVAGGVLVGFLGVEHGFFEILQGYTAAHGVQINAIGPATRFWEYGTERALTLVPNFLITGILAVLAGLLVILYSVFFIHRRHGGWIFLALATVLFLVGGGFAPYTMALFIAVAAGRINKPLHWGRRHLPPGLRDFLARGWPISLVVLVLWCLVLLEIGVFGYPLLFLFNADIVILILWILAYSFLAALIFTLLSAFASDIRNTPKAVQAPADRERI